MGTVTGINPKRRSTVGEQDCALFEQHLLPGVHCPLCGDGRLQNDAGGCVSYEALDLGLKLFRAGGS